MTEGRQGSRSRERSVIGHVFNRRRQIVLSLLERSERGKILDVGCGPGLMAEPCLDIGYSFAGTDISEGMVAEARKKCKHRPGADFRVGKLQLLPFLNGIFNVVLCIGALEYVDAWEQLEAISK